MQTIPLQPVPSQTTKVILGGQNCQISIYQKTQGMFVDIISDGIAIVSGVIALDVVPINNRKYMAFIGNILFVDTQGSLDPDYTGLGSRYDLVYLTAEEFELIQ